MATIIEVGDSRFIAGDPATELEPCNHWCDYCGGAGLEEDFNGDLVVCGGCEGFGQVECDVTDCEQHPTEGAVSAHNAVLE